MISLSLNDTPYEIDIEPDTPLLWVIRESIGLTGTKFGCGIGACGSCTVLIDDKPVRSCLEPVSSAIGKRIITIEGIAGSKFSPLLSAWLDADVSECGYCQPGQIMSAAALLSETSLPTVEQINAAMNGNLCRCGMYGRIRKAIQLAAETIIKGNNRV